MAIILDYASPPSTPDRNWRFPWRFATLLFVALSTSGAAWSYRNAPFPKPCQIRLPNTKIDLEGLCIALDAFEVDNGRYPTESEGLSVLVVPPADKSWKWRGPYIKQLPTDQWGHAYIYHAPASAESGYRLLSSGPDGIEGTSDDIVPGS